MLPGLLLLLGALVLAGCTATGTAVTAAGEAEPAPAADRPIFAYVGDQPVYRAELLAEIDKLPYYYQLQLEDQPAQRQKFVDNYLTSRLMLQEAQALHLDETDTFTARLAEVRRELLMEYYTQYLVTMVPLPGEAEVAEYYQQNPDEFRRPTGILLAYLLVGDRATADRLAQQLKSGANFEAVLARESQATDTMVFLSETQLAREPELKTAVGTLTPGRISVPFSRDGNSWYLFKKLENVPSGLVPLDECRDQARQQAHKRKVSLFITAYVEKLKRDHPFRFVGE